MLADRAESIVKGSVTVVVVFDCPHTLPAKAEERARRREARSLASVSADGGPAQPTAGDGSHTAALPAMADVHGKLQTMVWEAMQLKGIPCLMSPAEADDQLVMLYVLGLIWAALTVDSDLLAMGVPCFMNYKARTDECLFIDVPFWRPIKSWAEGEEDPLEWLVEAYKLVGDARARSALMLYACIAHSDFNVIPQMGRVRAVILVRSALRLLPAYEVTAFRSFIGTFVNDVHASHARSTHPERRMTSDQVRAGMLKAFTVFSRSLAFDPTAGRERPLALADEVLTPYEEALWARLVQMTSKRPALLTAGSDAASASTSRSWTHRGCRVSLCAAPGSRCRCSTLSCPRTRARSSSSRSAIWTRTARRPTTRPISRVPSSAPTSSSSSSALASGCRGRPTRQARAVSHRPTPRRHLLA